MQNSRNPVSPSGGDVKLKSSNKPLALKPTLMVINPDVLIVHSPAASLPSTTIVIQERTPFEFGRNRSGIADVEVMVPDAGLFAVAAEKEAVVMETEFPMRRRTTDRVFAPDQRGHVKSMFTDVVS